MTRVISADAVAPQATPFVAQVRRKGAQYLQRSVAVFSVSGLTGVGALGTVFNLTTSCSSGEVTPVHKRCGIVLICSLLLFSSCGSRDVLAWVMLQFISIPVCTWKVHIIENVTVTDITGTFLKKIYISHRGSGTFSCLPVYCCLLRTVDVQRQ